MTISYLCEGICSHNIPDMMFGSVEFEREDNIKKRATSLKELSQNV